MDEDWPDYTFVGWGATGQSVNPLTKASLVFGIDPLTGGQESVS